MNKIIIKAANKQWEASLNESATAREIYKLLPIKRSANLWGDEIYFSIPVDVDMEAGAKEEVESGTLAYWPPGNAFCLFFGPTPASNSSKPKAASPVNIIGKLLSDFKGLKTIKEGEVLEITAG